MRDSDLKRDRTNPSIQSFFCQFRKISDHVLCVCAQIGAEQTSFAMDSLIIEFDNEDDWLSRMILLGTRQAGC